MMKKACKVLLGLTIGAFTLPAWGLQPSVNGEVSVATEEADVKKWSVTELRQMSMGTNMKLVVSSMAGVDGMDKSGVTMFSRIQDRVAQVAVADLREVIIAQANSGEPRKTNKLADFAGTKDPAATCAAANTAGWGGDNMCAEQCIVKRYSQSVASHEGACLLLCALATDPCTEKSSWTSSARKWSGKTGAMLMKVVPATVASLKKGMSGGKDLVMAVRKEHLESLLVLTLAIFLAAQFGMEMFDFSKLKAKARRADFDLLVGQMRTRNIKHCRVFKPRKKKARQYGLYNRNLVGWRDHLGIEKAKTDAAHRREACDSLAAGLASASEKTKMASSFARWKGKAAPPG